MANLGQLIRELRQMRGLSQKELARRAGTSGPHINQIESGRIKDIHCALLLELQKALGDVELLPLLDKRPSPFDLFAESETFAQLFADRLTDDDRLELRATRWFGSREPTEQDWVQFLYLWLQIRSRDK